MLIGYARVSTQDQNLDLQIDALTQAGCKKLFEDKISGSRAARPGLAKTLVVCFSNPGTDGQFVVIPAQAGIQMPTGFPPARE